MRRLDAPLFGLAALATVALLLTFVIVPGVSQKPAAPIQKAAYTPNGQSEGIAVHGHWTIEVRNPDGTLTERREFENALNPDMGAQTLAKLLARQVTPGGWTITLAATPTSGTLPWDGGGFIVEGTYPRTESNRFKTLTISVPTSGDNRNKLVLSGSATAQREGNIGFVGTLIDALSATEVRSSLYTMWDTGFTSAFLSSPVALTAGQTVTVTVVIGFS